MPEFLLANKDRCLKLSLVMIISDIEKRIGVQLLIFGGLSARNIKPIFDGCRQIGFAFCEVLFSHLPFSAEEVANIVKESNFPIKAIHLIFSQIGGAQRAQIIAYAGKVGASCLICSGIDADQFDDAARLLNEMGEDCSQAGIRFYYHLHVADLCQDSAGITVLDRLIDLTNPKFVSFVIDVLWATEARICPADLIRRLMTRCDYFHLKDGDGVRGSPTEFLPLGTGSVNIADSLKWITKIPDALLIVEQDLPQNSPLPDLEQGYKNLIELIGRI